MTPTTPTNCPELEDYLNGEGLPAYREAVERHLQVCEDCRSIVEAEAELHVWLRTANHQVVIPESCTALVATFPDRSMVQRNGKQSRRVLVWMGGVLTCAASIAIGIFSGVAKEELPSPITLEIPQRAEETPRFVRNESNVTVGEGWLIAAHPASDSDIEVYLVRPIMNPASKHSQPE